MENLTFITRRRLLTAMALSPLLWQMRGARAAEVIRSVLSRLNGCR